MMKRLFPLLAVFTLLASPAGALKMSIWDREMQTTLGAGESSGSRFNVQLIKNFSGPVIVIFSQTEDEKKSNAFSGLQNRYDGVLKNGQLTLMPELPESPDKPDAKFTPTPGNQTSNSARSVGLTLTKLLQQFKLTVSLQTTSQTNPAPDNTPGHPGSPAPSTPGAANVASGGNSNGNFKALDLKGK